MGMFQQGSFCGGVAAMRKTGVGMLVALIVVLSGCAAEEESSVFSLTSIQLTADRDANGNRPVAVDLVIVYDRGMIGALSGLTAAEWFDRKDQFGRDFENGFAVMGWEMVPENSLPETTIGEGQLKNAEGETAQAGFLFARYATPGAHRARLESRSGLRVTLGRDGFTLETVDVEN